MNDPNHIENCKQEYVENAWLVQLEDKMRKANNEIIANVKPFPKKETDFKEVVQTFLYFAAMQPGCSFDINQFYELMELWEKW